MHSLENLASVIDQFENSPGSSLTLPQPTTKDHIVVGNASLGYAELPNYYKQVTTDSKNTLMFRSVFPNNGEGLVNINYTSNIFTKGGKEYTQKAYEELREDDYFTRIDMPTIKKLSSNGKDAYVIHGTTQTGDDFSFIVIDNNDRIVTFTLIGINTTTDELQQIILSTYQY